MRSVPKKMIFTVTKIISNSLKLKKKKLMSNDKNNNDKK